jgi:hypothetical protein
MMLLLFQVKLKNKRIFCENKYLYWKILLTKILSMFAAFILGQTEGILLSQISVLMFTELVQYSRRLYRYEYMLVYRSHQTRKRKVHIVMNNIKKKVIQRREENKELTILYHYTLQEMFIFPIQYESIIITTEKKRIYIYHILLSMIFFLVKMT